MLKYNLLIYPDIRLRNMATSVIKINNNIINIVKEMLQTMYFYKGIGLAASQINIHKKIIVIDLSLNKRKPFIFINPIILKKDSQFVSSVEGCLSIPNYQNVISRFRWVKIQAFNIFGKVFQIKAKKLLAICLQHEIDHLFGKLFIDYLSLVKQKILFKSYSNCYKK